jgi:hypothetical protein
MLLVEGVGDRCFGVASEGVPSMLRGEPVGNQCSSIAAEVALPLLLLRESIDGLPSGTEMLDSGAV